MASKCSSKSGRRKAGGTELKIDNSQLKIANSLSESLRRATRPAMTLVAPGVYKPFDGSQPVPEVTVSAWVQNADGTYRAIPLCERVVRLTARISGLLGFGRRYDTLLRLGRAGFVEIIPGTPRVHFINLTSWYNHLRRCAEDPRFWEAGRGNLEAYLEAM